MRLPEFIRIHTETILRDWDTFAATLFPAAKEKAELRDHAREMLLAMADDIERYQSDSAQAAKSKGEDAENGEESWAKVHGRDRHTSGFDVNHTVSEFRALRASVVLHWAKGTNQISADDLRDLTRFHEAIDQAVAESLEQYTSAREKDTRLFEALLSASPDPIFVLDLEGRYVYANRATTDLLARPADSIIGKTAADLGIAFASELAHQHRQVVAQKTTCRGELSHTSPSRAYARFEFLLAPVLDEQGGTEATVCVSRDITDRTRAEEEATHYAHHDLLTGLPNRRLFLDRLGQEAKHAKRSQDSLAVLFMDLDGFKEINDSMGHAAGDQLLVDVARRLTDCVREDDTVARLGGDEFTVILTGTHQPRDVELVARSIINAMALPFRMAGKSVHISASIGSALFPQHASSPEDLLRAADQAMFRAKKSPSNRFCFYGAPEDGASAPN